MAKNIKNELNFIISGKSKNSDRTTIETITDILRECHKTSPTTETTKQLKKQEAEKLINFASENDLWFKDFKSENYISEGAEQRVYLKDGKLVYKLNDAIYYETWLDYFINILLHNYFFPDTAYTFVGFVTENEILYSVIQQNFIQISSTTDLNLVKEFMHVNGFINHRNNDYINKDFGIILEDLHDENVLTNNDILYFIDTVFYLIK